MSEKLEEFKYYAFVSYSSADREWADWIRRRLESFRIPRYLEGVTPESLPRTFRPIFQDRAELRSSASLRGVLEEALVQSRYLIVICSPASARSRWVNEEIRYFKSLGRDKRILSLIVEGDPDACTVEEGGCFPPELRLTKETPDSVGSETQEDTPGAADARPGRDEREGALLRIIAGLLSVNREAVVQSYRRRRRRQCLLASFAAFLCLIAAVWTWDFYRVKVSYFETYQSRWGIPKGILPLSKEARRYREYYRFESSRGRLRKVQILSSKGVMQFGQLRSDIPATQIAFEYRENGTLQESRYLDRFGKLLVAEEISPDRRYLSLRDKNGLPKASASQLSVETNFTRGGPAYVQDELRNLTQIARQELEYNALGQIIRLRYQDVLGSPARERDGTFGASYRYDEQGDLIETISSGPDGYAGSDHRGIQTVRMKYDDHHRMIEKTYLGGDDTLVVGEEGFARVIYVYNERGICIGEQMFGPSGNPAVVPANFSSVKFDYDEEGILVRTSYFGPDGAPTMHRNGFFAVLSKKDALGWNRESRFVDIHEKPCLNNFGAALVTRVHDSVGNNLVEKYYGVQEEPVTSDGPHEVVMSYDHRGNCTRREFRDAKGDRIAGKDGFAITEEDFDDRGRTTGMRFFDATGKLTYGKAADRTAAILKRQYSKDGRHVSATIFDRDGKPMLDQYGIHAVDIVFSPFGTVETVSLLGVDHEPVSCSLGFHRSECQRDAHGRAVSWAWFGPDGRPVVQLGEMIHRREWVYDSAGFVVAQKYVDTEGRPCLGKDGVAEIRIRNDEQGRVIASDYLGLDNKSIVNESGVAGVRNRYDARGNLIEMTTIGTTGEASESSLGYSVMRTEFDESNRATNAAAFDENGHVAVTALGHHRMASSYDARGKLIQQDCFGPDGDLVIIRMPLADLLQAAAEDKASYGNVQAYFASLRLAYDDMGRTISIRVFGPENQPISGLANAHEIRVGYNRTGIVTGMHFLDVRGQPIITTLGFASMEVRVDERGWPLETRYRGPDGRGIWRFDPLLEVAIAGALLEHDTRGRLTRAWSLDPDFHPATTTQGFAGVAHRYDPFGNNIEHTYLDLAGDPITTTLGYATVLREYDRYGHITRQFARDAAGNPAPIVPGTYTLVWESNVAGQTTRQLSLGADGQPISPDLGPPIIEATYDSRGLQTERCAFDATHKPITTSDGFSRMQIEYTPGGQILARRFFDTDGNLVEIPSVGYAEERMRYDKFRRRVEIAFFGAKGDLTGGKFGVARQVETYSQGGSEIRMLDERGGLVNGVDGWATMIISSSTPGALDLAKTFDAQGNHLAPALMVESVQPGGMAKEVGLQPNDMILRVGDWNCLKDNELAFRRQIAQFTAKRLTERGPVPAIIERNGRLLPFTFPPGLLGAVLKNRHVPEALVKRALAGTR
jgi:YD repeat-containing protein